MALTETSTATSGDELVPERPAEPAAPARSLGGGAAGNDHKAVGSAFIGLSLVFLIVGGILAVILRAQLTSADSTLLTDQQYRTLFTFHGSFSVFLFLLPAWIGVATAIVPLQLGVGRLAFPRLQTMALWLTVVGAALMVASTLTNGSRRMISGWTLDRPIPEGFAFRGRAVDFLVLGIAVVLAAAVVAAANLLVTIVRLRAPGLTARRLPLFSWSVLVSAGVLLLALPVLIGGLGMLYVDHHYQAHLFSGFTSSNGGNPLWWSRLFWFAAYPMLWALVLPALGLACEAIPVFSGRPIADRNRAMGALAAVGVLAFVGWGSEARNLPGGHDLFGVGALVVLLPVASLFVNWLLTLRKAGTERGVDVVRSGLVATPMVHVAGYLVVLAAGMAASVVSAIDAAGASHANYWQVGEQHLLFFAPATLAVVAAAHYWGPKLWARHLSDKAGKLEVLLLAGGSLLGFGAALVLGAQSFHVHTSTYSSADKWHAANIVMSIGSGVLTLGVLVFALDLLFCVVFRRGRPASPDPWRGHTLEWVAPTPVPRYNFDRIPEIRSATPALDVLALDRGDT